MQFIGSRRIWQAQKGNLLTIIFWFIWRARNKEVFSDEVWLTWFINHQIFLLYDILNSTSSFHQPRQHVLVQWSPHSDLFFKLNTDGSPLGNLGPSGFGGVIRNGQWFFSFFGSEVFAIYNGLKLAYDRGIHNLVCESDSKIVLHLIKENKNPFQPYNAFIHKIQQYIVEPWHLSFKRETIARFG